MTEKKCKWCERPAVVVDSYGQKCAECWLGQTKEKKRENHRRTARNR